MSPAGQVTQDVSFCRPSAEVQQKHLKHGVKERREGAGRRIVPAPLGIPRLGSSAPQLDAEAALTGMEAGRRNPLTFRAFRDVGPELFYEENEPFRLKTSRSEAQNPGF